MPQQKTSEITANVRLKKGGYVELAAAPPNLISQSRAKSILKGVRLRLALTTACQLRCIFCSNEGAINKSAHIPVDIALGLIRQVAEAGIFDKVDLSGGEPLLHEDLRASNSKLNKQMRSLRSKIKFSLHTNGVLFTPPVARRLYPQLSRIGIAIHSFDFDSWVKITRTAPTRAKHAWVALHKNLAFLSKIDKSKKVVLKSVIVRDQTSTPRQLKQFLDGCLRLGFYPKLLQLEPITKTDIPKVVPSEEVYAVLRTLGCRFPYGIPKAAPKSYVPAVIFEYKGIPGVYGIFGCGTQSACNACYQYMCAFVKPSVTGGAVLKPCSPLETNFDLTRAIKTNNHGLLRKLFKMSREYLLLKPGLGLKSWTA